jgi:membrane-associated phospholipid phosphatase
MLYFIIGFRGKFSMRTLLVFLTVFSFTFAAEEAPKFEFNYKPIIIGTALTVAAFSIDKDVKKIVQSNKNETLNTLSKIFNEAGSEYSVGIPIAGYIIGYYTNNQKFAEASKVSVASAVVAASITFPIKYAVNRERPDRSDNDSFPSGHTALAFAIFGSYAKFYNEGITPYLLYTTAALTGFSRIYKNKHYLSDVVAGATIGIISIPIGQWLEENLSVRFGIGGYIRISKKEAGINLKYNF